MLSMRLRLGKKAVVVLACLLFVGVGAVCFAILFGGSSFVKSDPQLLTLRETESLIGLDVELEYVMKLYRTVPESGKVVPAPSERPVMTPWEPDEGSLYLGTEHRIHYWQHGKKVRWDSVHFPYSAWDEQKVQTREPYSASVIYGGVQMIERGKMIIGVDDKVARPYASIQRNAIMSLFSLRGIVTALTSGKISHNAPHMIDTPFNIFSFGTERLLTDAIDLMAKSVERTVEIADKIGYRIEYPKTSIQTLLGITRTETCDLYLDRARGCLPSAKIKFD